MGAATTTSPGPDPRFLFAHPAHFVPLAALAVIYLGEGASRPRSLMLQALAFVLFRIFDIWKPFPIREMERRLKGGLGVMADDLLAACYACVVFILVVTIARQGFGV